MTDLSNQVILVSGASRGIGRATALRLAERGATVVAVARDAGELADLTRRTGGLALAADLTEETASARVVADTLTRYGRLDAVVCNAGVGTFQEVENVDPDEWNRIFDTNVRGTFLLCRAAVPVFKAQQRGHLVGIASDLARRAVAHTSAYAASKHAQAALLASLRPELRPYGIKVSVLFPGLVDTHFFGTTPGRPGREHTHLQPDAVADAVRYVLEAPPHVVIDELMLHPLGQGW